MIMILKNDYYENNYTKMNEAKDDEVIFLIKIIFKLFIIFMHFLAQN
jgi:hypothetical protein